MVQFSELPLVDEWVTETDDDDERILDSARVSSYTTPTLQSQGVDNHTQREAEKETASYESPCQLLTPEQTPNLDEQQDRPADITDPEYRTEQETPVFREIGLDLFRNHLSPEI